MALTWEWNNSCGTAVIEQRIHDETREYNMTLYEGNAYLIMLHEYTENDKDMYELFSFWLDKAHMERMLGISNRGKRVNTNTLDQPYNRLKSIRLDKSRCRNVTEIAKAIIQAFDNIEIEIYTSERK